VDLTTSYLGLSLKHPVVASASPLSATVDGICRLEEAGANVVMLASEMLKQGLGRIGEIVHGMHVWMTEREYESVSQMRGSMSQMCADHHDRTALR
jgi:hypothetical protein